MNGSTKILTVSYGTFSCTLEGFDDPLGSMREIAEYFRDLAADDRYFGAEPPTPDVEMLQSIAEKEARRRVEARVSDAGVALVASDPVPSEAEPEPEAVAEAETKAPDVQNLDDDTKGPLTFDDDFLMSDEPEDVLAIDPDASAPISTGPAESVAEKLRRIRAVVSRSVEAEDRDSFRAGEAISDDSDAAKRDRALTETIQQITADLSDDEDADDVVDHGGEVADYEEASEEVDAQSTAQDGSAEDENTGQLAVEDDQEDDITSDYVSAQAPGLQSEPAEDDDGDDVGDDAPEGLSVSVEDDSEADERSVADVMGKITGRLSEAEADEEFDEDATDDDVPVTGARVTSRTLPDEPEEDVGRLLDETDNKLNEDETVRRRRVISQMRAAVAATKADRLVSRQVSRQDQEEAEKNPYREDLSEVVQTKPLPEPAARKTTTAPPLMLVSSQRIDIVETTEAFLQETSKAKDVPQSFADFAESVGAKELHELLEAAAAYTVFAEGQASFTRPEIMKRVARMDPSLHLSREDGLRSFGQLLRQGKFKKLERGQFTIDEDTRFNPEQRFVGE